MHVKNSMDPACSSGYFEKFNSTEWTNVNLLCFSDSIKIASFYKDQGWISDMGIDGPTFVPKSS